MDNRRLRLVAYLRVSSNQQVEDGTIIVQRQDITRWAKAEGHRIVKWCADEGLSGSLHAADRPGLADALRAIEERRADGIVMQKLDRFARELTMQEVTLSHIWYHDGRTFTVDYGEVHRDDPADPMRTTMRQMMGAFAQLERAMISTRVTGGMRAKAERDGYAGGRPPFGWKLVDKVMVKDEAEQETVQLVVSLHEAGTSYRNIADVLNAGNRLTKTGGQWSSAQVHQVWLRHQLDPEKYRPLPRKPRANRKPRSRFRPLPGRDVPASTLPPAGHLV